jgi:hypothetical protein
VVVGAAVVVALEFSLVVVGVEDLGEVLLSDVVQAGGAAALVFGLGEGGQ